MEVTVRVFEGDEELGGFKKEIELGSPDDRNGRARAEVGEEITRLLKRLEDIRGRQVVDR